MKDDSIYYFIANSILYFLMFLICVIICIKLFDNIAVIVIALVFMFFVCGYVEEKILSKYVNYIIEKLLEK